VALPRPVSVATDLGAKATGGALLEITRVLAEERPDVVLTFGPDGITGHPDHIAVGAATTTAFARLAGDGGPGFARLYHAAWKQSALDRLNARRVADGLELFDPAVVFHPRGVPDEQIACTIDQRPAVPLIRAAFRAHRTRRAPFWAALDDRGWHSAAGENNLVQAWPPRPPGAAVRAAAGRTGSCLDNAVAESFFATLKVELLHRLHLPTRADARRAIFVWVHRYNHRRRHSTTGMIPPALYEQQQRQTRPLPSSVAA
jgi:LmbE family N-acetylglucosaminyl deacetylase